MCQTFVSIVKKYRYFNKSTLRYSTCSQREQLAQKLEKRRRARCYRVITRYSGSWVPVSYGWRVICHPPCTDEPRIKLNVGNDVIVTRWRRFVESPFATLLSMLYTIDVSGTALETCVTVVFILFTSLSTEPTYIYKCLLQIIIQL